MAATAPLHDYREPGKVPAGILAILVHVLFFAFLVFGFTWRTEKPEGMAVDLWESLPAPPQPAPRPVEVEPQPPKPVKEAPKEEAKPEPAKPDIQLKEKAEQERLKKEQIKKEEKRRLEQQKAEAIKEAKLREEEAARAQREQEEVNRKLQAQQAAEQAQQIDDYKRRIMEKIKESIVKPPDLAGDPVAEFDVILLPDGTVLSVKLKKSSNYPAWDSAVERAISKPPRLPLPRPELGLFSAFRELHLVFHYVEAK